jgi:hypothetical protein
MLLPYRLTRFLRCFMCEWTVYVTDYDIYMINKNTHKHVYSSKYMFARMSLDITISWHLGANVILDVLYG